MMRVRKKVVGAALASVLALGVPAAASAATIIPFGNQPATSGKFLDTFSFTLPSAGKVSITINSLMSGPLTNVNFRHNHVTFNGTPLTTVTKGVVELLQLINQPVAAGLQTLSIQGSAQKIGTYSGTLTFAAIPEPATWAMMMLGFGAIGYAMRRRPAKVAFSA